MNNDGQPLLSARVPGFKVKSISIAGFWQSRKASSDFRDDINIIIGKNGTGKTTFMNILLAVLAADTEALYENVFSSVTINLTDGKRSRKIRVDRLESTDSAFPVIEYHISNRRFAAPLLGPDEGRGVLNSIRRRALEAIQQIKAELGKLVSVASLSVYRIGGDSDPELRERSTRRYLSAVDTRLMSLASRLTQYQLELSNAAREISTELQREVLISLLYSDANAKDRSYRLDVETMERQHLVGAYKQLGVAGPEVTKKIQEHIAAVAEAMRILKGAAKASASASDPSAEQVTVDFAALEAYRLTRMVVEKSLAAEERTKAIFSQADLFIHTLKTFIADKTFVFASGVLTVESEGPIPLAKLSSGEKQLLILFIEALLQRQRPYIFLADEPELSLHISWQRNIITAIRSINPNAQVIVATHSPEVAGRFRDCILDMEDILRG